MSAVGHEIVGAGVRALCVDLLLSDRIAWFLINNCCFAHRPPLPYVGEYVRAGQVKMFACNLLELFLSETGFLALRSPLPCVGESVRAGQDILCCL